MKPELKGLVDGLSEPEREELLTYLEGLETSSGSFQCSFPQALDFSVKEYARPYVGDSMSANRPISETLVEDSYYPPCNQDVFKRGIGLVAVDGWAKDVEPWVRRVADLSGQLVDWHYSGGVANVLVLGDHAKATAAAKVLTPSPGIRVMRWFSDGASLFRAGDPVPEGVVCVDASVTIRKIAIDPHEWEATCNGDCEPMCAWCNAQADQAAENRLTEEWNE